MSERALNAILPLIATAPYEAHQKARTFSSRYIKSGKPDIAATVLFTSARELLKAGHTGSGVDLGLLMLDVDNDDGRITQLIALCGPGTLRKSFIDKALNKPSTYAQGDPALHLYVGELYAKEGKWDSAEMHLLNAGTRPAARLLADVYWAWGGAYGGFALRGTLGYLLNGNVMAAKTFINACTQKHDAGPEISDGVRLTPDPAVNFCQLAVAVCQRAAPGNRGVREAWVRLCTMYQGQGANEILKDREVRRVLGEIGELYFGIASGGAGRGGNPMAEMMKGLLGGGEGEKKRTLVTPVKVETLD